MVVDQLLGKFSQARTRSALDQLLGNFLLARTLTDLDKLLDQTTLHGILNSWIYECYQSNYSKRTLEHYYVKASEFLNFLGTSITDPKTITKKHVELFLTMRKQQNGRNPGQPCKPATLHGYFRALKRYFNYMVQNEILQISPMLYMKAPKVPEVVIQPYSENQIQQLLNACNPRTFLGARNRALILLFVSSGLRRDEMARMKLNDINITQQIITVMGKGAKERVVGFGKKVAKALMVYYILRKSRVKEGNEDWIWLSEEGTRLGYWGIGKAISVLVQQTGLTDIHSRVHAMRHSFGTESLRNGAQLHEVQKLLGHATQDMSLRYSKTVNSWDAVKQHPKFDPVDNWKLA